MDLEGKCNLKKKRFEISAEDLVSDDYSVMRSSFVSILWHIVYQKLTTVIYIVCNSISSFTLTCQY